MQANSPSTGSVTWVFPPVNDEDQHSHTKRMDSIIQTLDWKQK